MQIIANTILPHENIAPDDVENGFEPVSWVNNVSENNFEVHYDSSGLIKMYLKSGDLAI